VTDQELRTALQSGKSLADVAKAQGKTTEGLQKAMVDAIAKSADAAVKDGKLTKQQRDDLVAKGTQWVQHEITETHTGHPGGGFGGGGPFGPGPGDDGGQNGSSGNGTGGGQNDAPSGDILQST
jgi:hypothetical protein